MNDLSHFRAGSTTGRAKLLESKILNRLSTVGIIGLGYVGLPLATTIAKTGFRVIGFDVDAARVNSLNAGASHIEAVKCSTLSDLISRNLFKASEDMQELAGCDIICICVPTPLSKQREPDLSFVADAGRAIAFQLRRDQLIILESTTYPGTTDEILKPILETAGLVAGTDFFVGYSPEREDPGNKQFTTAAIPKVVSGDGLIAQHLVETFYGTFIERVVPVSSIKTAEVVKITENVFRAVNIGLINELKVIYTAMGIDVWEVIEAAKTKPFGYMPFYPGPGLGGHCIPVDPFYLTWKSREFELPTRFIELAGEINQNMPKYIVARLEEALDSKFSLAASQATVLVVGAAYKKNVPDVRESPSLKIMELLGRKISSLAYHDPFVSSLSLGHDGAGLTYESVELTIERIAASDAVLILTDHDCIDYGNIANHARLVVDTRNALRSRNITCKRLVSA
jgi:UDP-N-acetyl-D-glucosamine dehydrogenase